MALGQRLLSTDASALSRAGRRRRVGRALVWLAASFGVVHAGFSLYWAAGGRWLVPTLGEWAVRAAQEQPARTALALAVIGVVKLVAAATPVAVEYGVVAGRRLIRAVSWLGSIGLIAYGGTYAGVGLAVLAGLIRPDGGYERDAMIGHAALWDPLFLLWGVALATSLALTRGPGRRGAES